MSQTITATGIVGKEPHHTTTPNGLAVTSFRLGATSRRYDRTKQEWVDNETVWFTVVAWRQLALNAAASIERGQRVIVTGKVRINSWETTEKKGTVVEIDAESIGHDLAWGTAKFTRVTFGQLSRGDAETPTSEIGWATPGGAEAPEPSPEDDDERPAVLGPLVDAVSTPF